MLLLTLPIFPLPERSIPLDCMMYEHLQKWGPRKQEVKFFLRHEETPEESSDQGGCLQASTPISSEPTGKRSGKFP